MKAYIGTKIIKAELMGKNEFENKLKGGNYDLSLDDDPGYHVQYPDGYDSWKTKTEFEEVYRPVSADEKLLMTDGDSKTEG